MKKTVKTVSAVLAALLLSSAVSVGVSAEEVQNPEQIRIIIENQTCAKTEGAAWEGVLLDEWVTIDSDSTLLGELTEVLAAKNYTQTGIETNYITELGGLSAGDCGDMSCWMLTLDSWITDTGADAFTYTSGKLADGDTFSFEYSASWGSDLNYDWQGTSTQLDNIVINGAEMTPAFSPDIMEYTAELSEGVSAVTVIPKAQNNAFRTKLYKNEYTPEKPAEFKISREIPITDGDEIYIGVGNSSWQYTADGVQESVYKISFHQNSEEVSEISEVSEASESSEQVSEVSEVSESSGQVSEEHILEKLEASVKSNENFAVYGNEWNIISLARANKISEKEKQAYISSVKEVLSSVNSDKLSESKATENAKVVLALTAIGCDASDFYGYDLIKPLLDFDYDLKQGINGGIYALLALDSHDYASDSKIREKLVEKILSAQLSDGGWTFYGEVSDPDMTSMAIYALAPYDQKDEKVASAINQALKRLSAMQENNGAYSSFGSQGCDSCAQVLLALTSLNIDIAKDERFIKNNHTVLDAVKLFWLEDSSAFSYLQGEEANAYSTAQAYLSLCAYERSKKNQNFIYQMSDVTITELKEEVSQESENSENSVIKESTSSQGQVSVQPQESQNSDNNTVPTGSPSERFIFILFAISALTVGLISFRKKFSEK